VSFLFIYETLYDNLLSADQLFWEPDTPVPKRNKENSYVVNHHTPCHLATSTTSSPISAAVHRPGGTWSMFQANVLAFRIWNSSSSYFGMRIWVCGAGAWRRAGIETWVLRGQRVQQGIPVALSRRELGVWMWIRLWMKPEEDTRSLSCSDGLFLEAQCHRATRSIISYSLGFATKSTNARQGRGQGKMMDRWTIRVEKRSEYGRMRLRRLLQQATG
jgi:hypothetical protein